MLISEALNSDKSWVEIKDLLHLKFCNLDIHTSVSHFMEIQQRQRIFGSLHTQILKGSQKMQLQQQCSHDLDICKRT